MSTMVLWFCGEYGEFGEFGEFGEIGEFHKFIFVDARIKRIA